MDKKDGGIKERDTTTIEQEEKKRYGIDIIITNCIADKVY